MIATDEKLVVKEFKKGDKTVGTYVGGMPTEAGEDMLIASAYGIYADLFDKGNYYQCPVVQSTNTGSGKFLDFLLALKAGLDKPVYFCSITNQRIYKYLEKAGIGVVVDGKFYKVQAKEAIK